MLAQKIAGICRGVAKRIVFEEQKKVNVSDKNLQEILGIPRFENEAYQKIDVPGVAIGLAWTSVGGEILFIESTITPGNGKLSMTGQLGEVMKESATLAFTYLRAHASEFGIPYEVFKRWDVHLHIPAGAIPKDGPSAGITLLTSLASLFSQRMVRSSLAMTGEITLRGKVLPVGGIKEKVLAARRAGITQLILCAENKKDVSEINQDYIKDLDIKYVSRMSEVIRLSLEDGLAPKALTLTSDKKEEEPTMLSQMEQIRKIVGRA